MACVSKRRGKWVVDFRDNAGKRRWETFTTRAEADIALAERVTQLDAGKYIAPAKEKTFKQLCEDFTKATKPTIKPNTWRDYEANMRLHVRPFFGDVKIRLIMRQQIEGFRDACIKNGVGAPTTKKCLRLLSGMLGYALKNEWISVNRAKGISPPLGDAEDPRDTIEWMILSPAEFALVLKNAAEKWRLIIQMAGLTGMRQGELIGLPWRHVHLDTATVDVRTQVTARRVSTLKTKASRRTVNLTAPLVAALRKHKLESKWSKPDDLNPGASHGSRRELRPACGAPGRYGFIGHWRPPPLHHGPELSNRASIGPVGRSIPGLSSFGGLNEARARGSPWRAPQTVQTPRPSSK